jgi:multidrug efflux pump subunit AcrA (membrane-fusion protein)
MKKISTAIRNNRIKTILILVLVLIIIGYFVFHNKSINYQFVNVEEGSITESVSLTGNTTPEQSVSLSFGSNGIVSNVYTSLGKEVKAGQVLAGLDTKDLQAQLHSAQAGLTIAKQNASTSENNVTNVTAQQDVLVKTAYQNLLNSTPEAIPADNKFTFLL